MRFRASWRALLIGTSAVILAVLALTLGASDPPPSERDVERGVRALASRGGFPLHEVRCIRDEVLRRTFVCLVEGPDDTHLAWRVRWVSPERLDVRRPDGSHVPF